MTVKSTVNPLEWVPVLGRGYRAMTPFGSYQIRFTDEGWWMFSPATAKPAFAYSLSEAKQLAQDDFDGRILSVLPPHVTDLLHARALEALA